MPVPVIFIRYSTDYKSEKERERQREKERALGSNGENVNKQYISGWCIQFDA